MSGSRKGGMSRRCKMRARTLPIVALALLGFPAAAPAETCVVVGGAKAPVEIRIFDESQQGAEGKQLYAGRLNREQRIPVTVSYLKFLYQYRVGAADPWSTPVSEWCQRGENRLVP
jgi:hypothetical protein